MSNQQDINRITRRSVLEGIGVGALGLAGAAVLGCSSHSASPASKNTTAASATPGNGTDTLQLTAPIAQGRPRLGGTLTTSIGATTYTEHDSHTQRGADEWQVISEKLLEADPITGKTLPMVATSWETPDPQGLTLLFHIRPGIKIHNIPPWNGREFDAQDVAWNLERIGGLYADRLKIPLSAFQRASMVQNLTKAEAVDKYTVKVTLSSPNSGLFAGMSENRTNLMPKEMDDVGFNDPMKFGGIAAFQMADFKKDQVESYKRFDNYFRPGEPHFDAFAQISIPDSASTLAAFASNQIQIWTDINATEAQQVQQTKPDHLLYTWINANWHHIRPSMTYQPFQDFRVRKAIHLGIDYPALGNIAYGSGWGYQAALNPAFPEAWTPDKVQALPGYNPATKVQDRQQGMQMLAAAGYPNGKGIDFDVLFGPPTGIQADVATGFQSQMTTTFTDMKVALRPVDAGTFSTQQAAGTFKSLSYSITCVPDAVLEMIALYDSQGSRNYGHFNDKNLDAALDKALKELNVSARRQLLDDFQTQWINTWQPMYVICADATREVTQSNIGGFDTTAGPWFGYGRTAKAGRWFYVDK